jgi:hypothetical protein
VILVTCHRSPAAVRVSGLLKRSPKLGHLMLEFPGVMKVSGLAARRRTSQVAFLPRIGGRPPSHRTSLHLSGGTEIFDAETNPQTGPSSKQRPPAETDGCTKNPYFGAINAKRMTKVSTQGLGGGGSSRAKPVSKSRTGNFLKIPGQNRFSER